MGDVMPERRKRFFYRIFNWIDLQFNNFVEMTCNFCGKKFKVTRTEFRAAEGNKSCSNECAKTRAR